MYLLIKLYNVDLLGDTKLYLFSVIIIYINLWELLNGLHEQMNYDDSWYDAVVWYCCPPVVSTHMVKCVEHE